MDTIAAIATPAGEGGIGIIRISGPEAPAIAERIWRGKCAVSDFESHKLYYGEIGEIPLNPLLLKGEVTVTDSPLCERGARGDFHVLDKALITWMKAPHSYTGEDVIELQIHGGPALLEQILQLIIQCGARLARPGEFTERAFLNGRMDLTQAEAVADLIQGRSELALDLARDQLSGRLKETVDKFRRELIAMRAQLEAMIDHPEEEDVEKLSYNEVAQRVGHVSNDIRDWLGLYDEGRRRREGVRVALVGRPNVGKSSLLNCLLSDDRAIVHREAGTTRDVVTETIQLGGILIRLCDTAGLREGEVEVEAEGVRRSWQEVERADLVLFVMDRSQPLSDEDQRLYAEIQAKPHLVLFNKSDLASKFSCDSVSELRQKDFEGIGPAASDNSETRQRILEVSAKTEEGLPELKEAIVSFALPHGRSSDQLFISNLRHKVCLEKTVQALNEVGKSAENEAGLELLASDLLIAANHLGEITGEITHDEILTEIFSRFCLGK